MFIIIESDNVFGIVVDVNIYKLMFFMVMGFYGVYVIIGIIFLIVCLGWVYVGYFIL